MSQKFANKAALSITGKSYWAFYKRFLVCGALIIPLMLLRARISLTDIAIIILPIKPNVATDPWWYVFCHTIFCFLLFPFIRYMEKNVSGRAFFIIIFCITVLVILLPLSFSLPLFPEDFRKMWESIPILRTVMVIPYYLLGYSYFKHVHTPERFSGLFTFLPLLIFTLFPFSAYDISGISAINIGFSFILCSAILRWMYEIPLIKLSLSFLGTHSTYMWLLHMPVCFGFEKLPIAQHIGIRFGVTFAISLLLSIILTSAGEQIRRLIDSRHASAG